MRNEDGAVCAMGRRNPCSQIFREWCGELCVPTNKASSTRRSGFTPQSCIVMPTISMRCTVLAVGHAHPSSDILALMSPDAAQHLTVELASQAQQVKQSNSPGDLPKIQGQPAGQ